MRRKNKKVSPVHIVDIADKGQCIGKDEDGVAYLLNSGVPGDVVEVNYYRNKKGMRNGRITHTLSFSEDRIDAKCRHFDNCGGCKWQHLSYPAQLKYKEKAVKAAIERIAGEDPSKVEDIQGCNQIYYYRNKLEYSFSNSRWFTHAEIESGEQIKDRNALGFHPPGSFYKVVDIQECLLQDELTNQIRNFVREFAQKQNWSFYNQLKHQGFLRNLIIRNSELGEWMIILSFATYNETDIHILLDALINEFPGISSLNYVINSKKNDSLFDLEIHNYYGKSHLSEKIAHIDYHIGPKSFFQTNSKQAAVLFDKVIRLANLGGDELVFDLYTGIGSIALLLANECREVIGIEEVEEAIDYAIKNAEINGISNALFFAGDVKNILKSDHFKNKKPDLVVIDPPRAGIHKEVVDQLISLSPGKIIYVSCNPATQARDINLLSEVYQLETVQPVDMFPHTHHTESVALLIKKENEQ